MEPVLLKLGSNQFFSAKDLMIQHNVGVKSTFRYHTHDYYEFFFVTSGRALHLVNHATQIVTRGSLVLVRPSDEHCYDYYRDDDFSFYNAGISCDFFKRVISYYDRPSFDFDSPLLPPKVHLEGDVENAFKHLLDTLKSTPDGPDRELLYCRVVAEVIYLICTCPDNNQPSDYPSWLTNVISEMDKPENFIAGLPRLIEIANYSQAHINRVFNKYLYTTPTKYINNLRLRYAYEMLVSTDVPILEVSIASGFNTISHFNTEFKETYGISPSKVRKNKETDHRTEADQ